MEQTHLLSIHQKFKTMKKNLIISFLALFSVTTKAQNATAYAYYVVSKNLNGKEIYIFTSPKSFQYPKGSNYVFNPIEFEKAAGRSIEKKLKEYDPSFNGLYVNQISNAANTSLKNLENTNQEIKNKMIALYETLQKKQYRPDDIKIIQIDLQTGELLLEYSIAAAKPNSEKKSAGNAY